MGVDDGGSSAARPAELTRKLRPGLELWTVNKIFVSEHHKEGKPVSLRVFYDCGIYRRVSEWACFEHEGFAKEKAAVWWRMHGGQLPIPRTALEARIRIECDELKKVVELVVDPNYEEDYPIIVGHRHEGGELEPGLATLRRPRSAVAQQDPGKPRSSNGGGP